MRELGGWVPASAPTLHVSVPAHASVRAPTGVRLHWGDTEAGPVAGVANIGEALIRCALDEDLEVSVPCFDWAWASGRLDLIGFESVVRALPADARCIRDWIDPASQSILESIARVRLKRHGWSVRSQIPVSGFGGIDLVIEDTVALETDGRTYHESSFETDRLKDLAITRAGRHAIQISRAMLLYNWAAIESAITEALRARGVVGKTGESLAEPRGRQRTPGRPELFT